MPLEEYYTAPPDEIFHDIKAAAMVICNHTWRATGITNFLENGGALEMAQFTAEHADPRTTRLYDRRQKLVTRSEVERIRYEKKKEQP